MTRRPRPSPKLKPTLVTSVNPRKARHQPASRRPPRTIRAATSLPRPRRAIRKRSRHRKIRLSVPIRPRARTKKAGAAMPPGRRHRKNRLRKVAARQARRRKARVRANRARPLRQATRPRLASRLKETTPSQPSRVLIRRCKSRRSRRRRRKRPGMRRSLPLAESKTNQKAIADELQKMLDGLSEFETYRGVVKDAQELLKQHEQAMKQTDERGLEAGHDGQAAR